MKTTGRSLHRFFLPTLLAAIFVFGGLTQASAGEKSPRATVERLYRFIYANDQNPREDELPKIQEEFDPAFYKSLMAAFKLPEAGLDFVPFTNAQDTVGPFYVGSLVINEKDAEVAISFGNSTKPSVKIELHLVGQKWLVKDVYYPARGDMPEMWLSKILAELLKKN